MTSEDVINVAKIVAEYLDDKRLLGFPSTKLYPKDEQNILDRYYSKHGISEQDWYEVAEKIR